MATTGLKKIVWKYKGNSLIQCRYVAEVQPEWGRRSHGPRRNKLAKIFTGILYQFSTVRKTV